MGYPDIEDFAYSFSHAELTAGPYIYTAIGGVDADQPTTEGSVKGTRPFPLKRTSGDMDMGAGTLNFTDEGERARFIANLGDAYREKVWTLKWLLRAKGAPDIVYVCYGCRVLGDPVSHKTGTDPLGGDVSFSFMYMTKNGKAPHTGLAAPTAP